MTSAVTAPLERQFGQMPGLDQMSSTSSGGASVITLRFTLAKPLEVAEQEVQAAINAAQTLLPNDLPQPPVYNKVNPADTPVLTLAVTSRTVPLPQVHDLVDTRVAQKLSQLPGVGLVSIAGGQRPAVRIQANPQALAAHGLNLESLRDVIAAANVNQPKGNFDGPERTFMLDANDQLRSPEAYRNLIVAYRDGAPLRLSDVAQVVDGAENRRLAAWADDVPAVLVNVQRQPGANVIEVVDRVQKLLPQLTASLPSTLNVAVISDRTGTIRASVRDVQHELIFAVALVVMVTFLFLRNVPATIIPSVVVPLSLVGTFGVMYLAGFSVNNLTLMALTIATGFVVDDAIVMVENIARHLEEGATPMTGGARRRQGDRLHAGVADDLADRGADPAAVHGRRRRPAVPRVRDHARRLDPDLARRLADADADDERAAAASPARKPSRAGSIAAPARSSIASSTRYGRQLDVGAAAPAGDAARGAADAGADRRRSTSWCRRGSSRCRTPARSRRSREAPQSVSFSAMAERQRDAARTILKEPDVIGLSSFIGVDGSNQTLNSGRMLITLAPHGERTRHGDRDHRAACGSGCSRCPASRCTCSRCRT